MKIDDEFDFSQLECQYFEVCKSFNKDSCKYNQPCRFYTTINNEPVISMRSLFRKGLENYVAKNNLKLQVQFLDEDRNL